MQSLFSEENYGDTVMRTSKHMKSIFVSQIYNNLHIPVLSTLKSAQKN